MANYKSNLKDKRPSTADAKQRALLLISRGERVEDAMTKVGRTTKTYEYWRKHDEPFRTSVDVARASRRMNPNEPRPTEIGFSEFSQKYLFHKRFWHQLQWIDVIEGREPRDLHPAQTYEPADRRRVLINTPPHHAKTSTLTIDYSVFKICMNPNVRIKVVSQTQTRALEYLYAIKTRLTHPKYALLQKTFAPSGGFRASADQWRADQIYLGSEQRDSGEKDPTVQALGIGGQVYGARSNLIILDDCIVGKNASEWEKQLNWLNREVMSRLGRTGVILCVGTRIAPLELYSQLRNGDNFASGKSPWTYLAQPAVLEYHDKPKDWLTLWPQSSSPIEEGSDDEEADEDGMYPAWDGLALAKIRGSISPADWSMVYQQQDVSDDAVFPSHAVNACVNGRRQPGPMRVGAVGHRRAGMDGLYVIGSMDPAMPGTMGALVYGVDRETRKRYVLTVREEPHPTPAKIRNLIKTWTDEYSLHEWRIEKQGYYGFITQDEELRQWLASRGVRVSEHITSSNKWDPNYGVASMAPLFGVWETGYGEGAANWHPVVEPLIELPARQVSEDARTLVEQLVTWVPDTKHKTDLIMALWFAEIRAREIVNVRNQFTGQKHLKNRYASPYRLNQRAVIDLAEYRQAVG
jgi:hypothetical protein